MQSQHLDYDESVYRCDLCGELHGNCYITLEAYYYDKDENEIKGMQITDINDAIRRGRMMDAAIMKVFHGCSQERQIYVHKY